MQVYVSEFACAAIRNDGTVVSWGSAIAGGDSHDVRNKLIDVKEIVAANSAFAATKSDGSVVAWGDSRNGGSCEEVQKELFDVQKIFASNTAFAAIRGDGKVVTWGAKNGGGDSQAWLCKLEIHEAWNWSTFKFIWGLSLNISEFCAVILHGFSMISHEFGIQTSRLALLTDASRQFKANCWMWNRSTRPLWPLLRWGKMVQWFPGGRSAVVATVQVRSWRMLTDLLSDSFFSIFYCFTWIHYLYLDNILKLYLSV